MQRRQPYARLIFTEPGGLATQHGALLDLQGADIIRAC